MNIPALLRKAVFYDVIGYECEAISIKQSAHFLSLSLRKKAKMNSITEIYLDLSE